MNVISQYRLTPPNEKSFLAQIVEDDEGFLQLNTDRGNGWEPEGELLIADLMRPEYRLNNWLIEEQATTQDHAFDDTEPTPLYVYRKLTNVSEFRRWALSQGFKSIVDDPHVTIVYSRQPVDWMKLGSDFGGPASKLEVGEGGPRVIEPLGDDGAVVLHFSCGELKWRHEEMVRNGASHDYPEYQPHVTITFDGSGVNLDNVEPYQGKLIFGPEVFRRIVAKVNA